MFFSHDADIEDELEACLLSFYYMYCIFRCFVFSERYVVSLVVLTMWMLVFNYYGVLYDVILFCKASLYICSIVFCPCAVSNTIDPFVLNLTLTIVHGRLAHFTALYLKILCRGHGR